MCPNAEPPATSGDGPANLTAPSREPQPIEFPALRHCRWFCRLSSVLAVVVGLLDLGGWALNIPAFVTVLPGLAPMKPNTAACFMLSGIGLWLLHSRAEETRLSPPRLWIASLSAGVVALAGSLTLAEYLFGRSLGIDQRLFPHALAASGALYPGRMSQAAATGFLLLGASLLLLPGGRPLRYPSQALAFFTQVIGLIGLMGYIYGATALYQVMPYSTMALHTSILFVLLGIGVLVSQPRFGLMSTVTSPRLGGLMARRLIPVASVLPVVIGWLRWQGELAGYYNTVFGLVVFTLSNIVMLNLLLWASALWLNRVDEQRQQIVDHDLRLAAIVDSSEDAILSKDLNGIIVSWNRGAERLYGYAAAEAIGQRVDLIIPADLQADARTYLGDIMQGRPVTREETVRRRKDGSLVDVSLVVSPVFDERDNIVGASSIAHDISERRRTLSALQESEERLRLFIEYAPAALAMFDRQMRYVQASRRWRTDYGLGGQALFGVSHYDLFPNIPERWREAHRRGIAGEVVHGDNDSFERSDGSVQWLRWEVRPWREETGEVGGILIFAEDITESKRADNALRESHARMKRVLEVETVGVMFWDLTSGHLIDANNTFLNLMGYSRSDVEARELTWQKLTPPEFMEASRAELRKFAASGRVGPYEKEYLHKDGTRQWFVFAGSSIGDNTCVEFCVDISGRKKAEEDLRESEERFQAVANGIPQLAWMAEADGHISWYNQRWYDYTGTRFEDMEGWGWQSVHHPDVLPEVIERWRSAIDQGKPFNMEFPLRGADGIFRTFLTRVLPLKNSDGRVLRWFGTNTDISERIASEKQLAWQATKLTRQAEELLRSREAAAEKARTLKSVLDNMNEGLIAADLLGNFILWNPAADRILGRTMQNVAPHDWAGHYNIFRSDTSTPFPYEELPLLRAIQGQPATAEMFVRHRENGVGFWIEASASPVRDEHNEICGGVVAFRDVTQRVLADREIRRLNADLERRVRERTAQLENSNQELESFTYSVSHDLRAPLRHIRSFAKILAEDFAAGLDPGAQHCLAQISHGAESMASLIDALLNLSRVNRQELQRTRTNLNRLVDEIVAMLHHETDGRRIEWKLGGLPALHCDPVLTRQIFQNLVSNAIKYSRNREQTVIEVGQILLDGRPAIFVRDNGAGFDMKYADKLFAAFQRLHRKEEFEGIGIGLATVARIVRKHGGKVWAEAELDRGATFFFTLSEEESEAPESKVRAAAASGK